MFEKEMMDKGIEPLPRDTSRFKKLAPDKPAVLPEGLKGELDPFGLTNLEEGDRRKTT